MSLGSFSIDTVVGFLSLPITQWSILLVLSYTLPKTLGKIIILTALTLQTITYLNNLYKRRGLWKPLDKDDLAIVTGGSNGLGLNVVKQLLKKKVRVIVIDIEPIIDEEISRNVTYINCDLSAEEDVTKVIEQIKTTHGSPSILINNAAIRHSNSLISLSMDSIHKIYQVNVFSVIQLYKSFINASNDRLYVVTIASILGFVSPANLSIYSSTKSSLISLHDSISHEYGNNQTRFLIVTPGQLNTRMFKDVKPPKQFLAPILDSNELAAEIVEKINKGERGTLTGPFYTNFIPILRILPYSFNEFARWFSEMDTSVPKE